MKAAFESDLREQLPHFFCGIRERQVFCCENIPIAQQFVDGWVLRHEIHGADRHLPIANAALCPPAEITLHEDAVSRLCIGNFLARMHNMQFFEIAFRHAGGTEHSVGTGSDGMQIELLLAAFSRLTVARTSCLQYLTSSKSTPPLGL